MECFPNTKASCANNMVSSLSVSPMRDYSDPRNKLHEVEEHIREADAFKKTAELQTR